MTKNIVIVGAGVIGLATALECQMRGHSVTVLEKGSCGGQASGAAAGMLAPLSEIEEDPDDFFRLCLKSLRSFAKWKDTVKKLSKHDFEYTNCGTMHAFFHEADILKMEMRTRWQKDFQVQSHLLTATEVNKLEPGLSKEVIGGLYYPEESHLYAPEYLVALQKACKNIGVKLIENVGQVTMQHALSESIVTDEAGATYSGDYIILCSGAWSNDWEDALSLRLPIFPIRGQICAYRDLPTNLRHIVYTSQGYLVSKENNTLICGASEDIAGFDTSVTERGIQRLEKWNGTVLPLIKKIKPFHKWAGLRPATQDGFPFLGVHPEAENVILSFGHYRNGILLSPITAETIANIIENQKPSVNIQSFAPERFTF